MSDFDFTKLKFDTVHFFCPVCDELLAEQTKAGSCEGKKYRQDSLPADIAMDFIGQTRICPVCDIEYTISGSVPRVSLYLTTDKKDNGYD